MNDGGRFEGQSCGVDRATESLTPPAACAADLWATYHSHTRRTAAPWVTGLHLPASHSITADSAHGSVGRGHVGGRSRVHGPAVPSWDGCVCVCGVGGEVRGHVDSSSDRPGVRLDLRGDNEDVTWQKEHATHDNCWCDN